VTDHFYDDIGFYVRTTEVGSHHANFVVFRVQGQMDDGQCVFEGSDGQAVFSIDEAQVFLHGDVKWDGCSNWYFDEQDEVMLHFCSKDEAMRLGLLMGRLYELAESLIEHWHKK
jgi:hypothetical protein